ncbi:MAG TPA: DUF2510 domain-containing protein [Homoserinimonas sp.]|nr:DUF2510 domain-containing protein [Homoserinimonas sp.]
MGVTATTRLPAGWYPDPEGGNRRRWWDGQEWTQYTAEFQRPTSVDDLNLEAPVASPGKKSGKPAKPARRLRRVEDVDDVEAPADDRTTRGRAAAERLGRWVAGAVHFAPSVKKRRRAHRSAD